MTTRAITYRICNGCGKDELNDAVEIVESRPIARTSEFDLGTIDLCYGCKQDGKFICRHCHEVHSDKSECVFTQLVEAARERKAANV